MPRFVEIKKQHQKTMKYLFTLVILSLSFLSFSQNNVTFKGKITNPTGEKVTLYSVTEENGRLKEEKVADSKLEKDGSFSMSFELEKQIEASFSDGSESTSLLLQPEDEIYMTLNTTIFDETIQYYGKGAEKNNAIKTLALELEKIVETLYSLPEEADTLEINTYVNFSIDGLIQIVNDYQSIEDFKSYGDKLIKEYEETKTALKKEFKENLMMAELMNNLKGTEGIDIKGIDLKGKGISLAHYKGKIIVIDFGAPWCAPCRAEMPAFKELEDQYGEKVNFISLGVYSKKKAWEKMATDLGFNNNIFVDEDGYDQFGAWMVRYIPRYVVLDENFKVVDADAARPSSGKLESLIVELLEK